MDEEIRKKILALLDQHRIMTIATLRPDGWPQATTVGYVNDGLTLYFLCGLDSQKAANLARDDRVSLAIDHDTAQIMEITGLSMAGRAQPVADRAEAEKVLRMLPGKYPEQVSLPGPMPSPDQVRIFRVTPMVISVLDYTKGLDTRISSPAERVRHPLFETPVSLMARRGRPRPRSIRRSVCKCPLQITFEHIAHVDYIEERARKEAEKLERFYDRITSARVVVGRPQHRGRHGDTYSVRLHLTIPGAADIAVSRDPASTGRHEDINVTLRDAFDTACRQLQDLARKRDGQVKVHEVPPHGVILSLAPEQDHGFIAAADGREIYFHRNSVAGGKFDSLQIGQEVRFSDTEGDKGPQATIVTPIGKHHLD